MKTNLLEKAKELGLNQQDISSRVNMIYTLADLIETYYKGLESKIKPLGYHLPKLKQECYELCKASRAMVRTVNKVCHPDNVDNFANDAELLYEIIEKFRKNEDRQENKRAIQA